MIEYVDCPGVGHSDWCGVSARWKIFGLERDPTVPTFACDHHFAEWQKMFVEDRLWRYGKLITRMYYEPI